MMYIKSLRSQKEQEVRQRLLNRLKDRYDVVIHQSDICREVLHRNQKQINSTNPESRKPEINKQHLRSNKPKIKYLLE